MSAEFIRRIDEEKFSPIEIGAQKTRQQLWAKAHSMVVKKACFVTHATGFSQWLMTRRK